MPTPRPRTPADPATSARIVLTLAGQLYEVRPTAVPAEIGRRAFRLLKPDGTIYDVIQGPFGPECDCPDYLFRRDGLDPRGCKHVRALVGLGFLAGTENPRGPLPLAPATL